ncbi:MAG: hypothetical protein ISS15_19150 [Alphaproteobacteria bacterium]|nr:hypothetical protein [Alphaproteobacteria bacterium]MBL7099780.1 hypothetical protein [Alphaproteobacteria bacterium]
MIKTLRVLTVVAAGAAAFAFATSTEAGGGLRTGEYACYGSGGELLVGLGFKVLDASHYNDLDGKSPGTYQVNGDKVVFHGGNLDGEIGVDLKGGHFNLASHGISCEPFG